MVSVQYTGDSHLTIDHCAIICVYDCLIYYLLFVMWLIALEFTTDCTQLTSICLGEHHCIPLFPFCPPQSSPWYHFARCFCVLSERYCPGIYCTGHSINITVLQHYHIYNGFQVPSKHWWLPNQTQEGKKHDSQDKADNFEVPRWWGRKPRCPPCPALP